MAHRVTPSMRPGLCALCAGSGMMPRSAPEHLREDCPGCAGLGAVA